VLLLDEPTAALDTEARGLAEALVERRRANGVSVVWVTHDAAQAARVARHLLTGNAGRVEEARP
jgi:ABC-type sulfate/molybdate transport systems ATPase subunit